MSSRKGMKVETCKAMCKIVTPLYACVPDFLSHRSHSCHYPHTLSYSLLKSITILPATSPRLNCCTLSGIALRPRTSEIFFS